MADYPPRLYVDLQVAHLGHGASFWQLAFGSLGNVSLALWAGVDQGDALC